MKYRLYLLFRKLLCHCGIHDYEVSELVPDRDIPYADLYCFYCPNKKRSFIPNS